MSYQPDMTPDYELGTNATYLCDGSFEPVIATCVNDSGTIGKWDPEPFCDGKFNNVIIQA